MQKQLSAQKSGVFYKQNQQNLLKKIMDKNSKKFIFKNAQMKLVFKNLMAI